MISKPSKAVSAVRKANYSFVEGYVRHPNRMPKFDPSSKFLTAIGGRCLFGSNVIGPISPPGSIKLGNINPTDDVVGVVPLPDPS